MEKDIQFASTWIRPAVGWLMRNTELNIKLAARLTTVTAASGGRGAGGGGSGSIGSSGPRGWSGARGRGIFDVCGNSSNP